MARTKKQSVIGLTRNELVAIQAFPRPGYSVTGKYLNEALRFPGWDNETHPGWQTYYTLQSLVKKGIVKQLVTGAGRRSAVYELNPIEE